MKNFIKNFVKKAVIGLVVVAFGCAPAYASGPLVQDAQKVVLVNPTDYQNTTNCNWQQMWRTTSQVAYGEYCVTTSSYNDMTNYGLNNWGASSSWWQNVYVRAVCGTGMYATGPNSCAPILCSKYRTYDCTNRSTRYTR
jgi:hypothetical protein